jgi:hypothetical protein
MYTQANNSVTLKCFKAGFVLLLAVSTLLFTWATPIFAAEDPAAPLDVTTTMHADVVTFAWSSTEDVDFTLYRSTTGKWEDAIALDTPLLALLDVNATTISYSFMDSIAPGNPTTSYWILKNGGDNQAVNYGPYTVQVGTKLFLPQVMR